VRSAGDQKQHNIIKKYYYDFHQKHDEEAEKDSFELSIRQTLLRLKHYYLIIEDQFSRVGIHIPITLPSNTRNEELTPITQSINHSINQSLNQSIMAVVTSPTSNKNRNPGIHRSRRGISLCKTTTTSSSSLSSLPILLLFVLAEQCSIVPVEGWSQSSFVTRYGTRQNALAAYWKVSSWKQSHVVKLQTTNGFFEDPSKVVQNQSNATAIATENDSLRDSVRQLEEENERLKKYVEQQHQMAAAAAKKTTTNSKRIILETFEGEHLFDSVSGDSSSQMQSQSSFALAGDNGNEGDDDDELWCDVLDGDECPLEPTVSFGEALRDRAYWLVGLLIMQSLSGIILSRNEILLTNHPVIIYYLTMMVGAGGNAGNQASVRGMCLYYIIILISSSHCLCACMDCHEIRNSMLW
jgi:hypothetical protein